MDSWLQKHGKNAMQDLLICQTLIKCIYNCTVNSMKYSKTER